MTSICELKWTEHCTADRYSRFADIFNSIGLGYVIAERKDTRKDRLRLFTSTGCILIIEKKHKLVITGFVADAIQVKSYFNNAIPTFLSESLPQYRKIYYKYRER